MGLRPDQIDDFVKLTISNFKRYKWTDIALEHQKYVANRIISSKSTKEKGGPYIEWRIKVRNTGNARNTGMFAQDVTNVEDVMIPARVEWSMQTTNFSYDIYEDLFQSDRETIIREMQVRDHDAMSDMAELNEENFWTAPASTSDLQPQGIPHWIVKDATQGEGGFTSSQANFAPGNVSPTTYTRWRNWAFSYTNPTVDDLVKRVKKAMAFTTFVAPVPHPELGFGKADCGIYTTYRTQEPLERLAETRNDNLGRDVARYINQVTIAGCPIEWVPYLEANDTSDPVYGIDWKYFRPVVKTGANMRRNPPKQAARQHTVREVHIDNWMQYYAVNRRALWVGSKS